MTEFGDMIIKARGDVTFTGIKLDIAKSAVQKYIRRGDEHKVGLILADINMVSMMQDKDVAVRYVTLRNQINSQRGDGYIFEVSKVQSHAKSITTNIINRLIVCGSEDVGIANNKVPDDLESLLTDRSLENQIKQGTLLARSQKLRLISDYKTMYMLPPYYWKNKSQETRMRGIHIELQDRFYPFMIPDLSNIADWEQALKQKKSEAFFYLLGRDLETDGYDLKKIGSNPVFSKLKTLLGSTSLTRIYTKMGHQEKPIYLYHEALRQMNEGQVQSIDVSDINPTVFLHSIQSGTKYDIDDFCMDRHTAQGRSCSTLQFAIEGAHVENQATQYYKWNNRLMYIIFKVVVDTPKAINIVDLINKIDHSILAQILPPLPKTLKEGLGGPQYDFLVRFYKGKINNKQASTLLNLGDPTQAKPKAAKPKAKFKPKPTASAKPKPTASAKPKAKFKPKPCPPKKILNPVSGKCVNKTGPIGTKLLASAKSKAKLKPLVSNNESLFFDPISRFQIGTGGSKTDVYYAIMKRDLGPWKTGERVVVKGPYRKGDDGCNYAKSMSQLKKDLSLPYVNKIICVELRPDLWPDVRGLGVRYSLSDKTTIYPFMISEDLMKDVDEIPLKDKDSKTWEKVTVVDFDHPSIKPYGWKLSRDWSKLIPIEQAKLTAYYVLRYLVGIGDLADRNFINISGSVYGIDEDAPKKITSTSSLGIPSKLLPGHSSSLVHEWLQHDSNWDLLHPILQKIIAHSFPLNIKVNTDLLSSGLDRATITSLF
jgi:hypothetical protein